MSSSSQSQTMRSDCDLPRWWTVSMASTPSGATLDMRGAVRSSHDDRVTCHLLQSSNSALYPSYLCFCGAGCGRGGGGGRRGGGGGRRGGAGRDTCGGG